MSQLAMTYVFLVGFMFMIEFGVSRAYRRPYDWRRTIIQSVCAVIGLTLYYAILAW